MKISNLINSNGNAAPNQFIINDTKNNTLSFQSYDTTICSIQSCSDGDFIFLDRNALNYSKTTSKHLFLFLGLDRKQIEFKIKDKSIKLTNLNK